MPNQFAHAYDVLLKFSFIFKTVDSVKWWVSRKLKLLGNGLNIVYQGINTLPLKQLVLQVEMQTFLHREK